MPLIAKAIKDRSIAGGDARQIGSKEGEDNRVSGTRTVGWQGYKKGPKKANQTGMPDNVKRGIEELSGLAMDDVRVHYNSERPSLLQAVAYAQGSHIYLGPGQENQLPHELWHVVQQAQGRVEPRVQVEKGVWVNDDRGLEHEAEEMGMRVWKRVGTGAVQARDSGAYREDVGSSHAKVGRRAAVARGTTIQRMVALAKKEPSRNFVELTSVNYGLKLAGPPYVLLADGDFSVLKEEDKLVIVGHGAVGEVGDFSADEIVERLRAEKTGLKNRIAEIRFTTCYAGKGEGDQDNGSVVDTLKRGFAEEKWKGMKIMGARGPSVKSVELGQDFVVLDDDKVLELKGGNGATINIPAWEFVEALVRGLYKPGAVVTKIAPSGDPKEPFDGVKDSVLAGKVSEGTKDFYQAYVSALKAPTVACSWWADGKADKEVMEAVVDAFRNWFGVEWSYEYIGKLLQEVADSYGQLTLANPMREEEL